MIGGRAALVAAALAVLVACGGDGGNGDDDGGGPLTPDEARRAVAHALVDEDDLGDGWDQTGTVDPDDVEREPDPFTACLGRPLERRVDDAVLARSEIRLLERSGEGPFARTEVTVWTIALDDGGAVDALFDRLADDAFPGCLADGFADRVGGSDSGLPLVTGEPDVDEGYVALDGVRSAHVSVPFRTETTGFRFEAEIDVVLVSRGQLVSALLTAGLGEPVDGEAVARLAALLADRQRLED